MYEQSIDKTGQYSIQFYSILRIKSTINFSFVILFDCQYIANTFFNISAITRYLIYTVFGDANIYSEYRTRSFGQINTHIPSMNMFAHV